MDSQRLRTFRTVATLMNFNQAAKVLHYAQSSVSAQIRTLEDEVGTALFKRAGKKITLTDAGEKMLKYAHKLLAIEDEAMAKIKGKTRTPSLLTLRMPQTIATYHLPSFLPEFSRHYPDVNFDISSCAFHSLEHELAIGIVDLAFLLADSVHSGKLQFELLKVEPLVLVAAPGHALTLRKNVAYRDLRGQTLFLPKADCGYRMTFEQMLAMENIKPAALIELNSIEAIKRLAMTGMGLTVIPRIAVLEELKQNRLVELAWSEDLETGICMIWHQDKWFSPPLTALMAYIRQSVR